jgi:hypothetical protein
MSDHCGSVVHADEPGASISVQDCLVLLKAGGRTELQLQEFRAGDRVQTERVHAQGSAAFALVLQVRLGTSSCGVCG